MAYILNNASPGGFGWLRLNCVNDFLSILLLHDVGPLHLAMLLTGITDATRPLCTEKTYTKARSKMIESECAVTQYYNIFSTTLCEPDGGLR